MPKLQLTYDGRLIYQTFTKNAGLILRYDLAYLQIVTSSETVLMN